MQYLIGVDLGTTATKAVLFEKDGKIIASSSQAYPLHRNASGMAEESLEEIFEAVLVTIREVSINLEDEDELLAVSFSTQMHSLIAFDENWQPLTRLITWADTRAVKYTEQIKASKKGYTELFNYFLDGMFNSSTAFKPNVYKCYVRSVDVNAGSWAHKPH